MEMDAAGEPLPLCPVHSPQAQRVDSAAGSPVGGVHVGATVQAVPAGEPWWGRR